MKTLRLERLLSRSTHIRESEEDKMSDIIPKIDTELFPLEEYGEKDSKTVQYRSYMSSPFIAASLPLKDVKKNTFTREYNNISLTLTSDTKVPYGKNGRLLLSILTTHAVLKKNKPGEPVVLEYNTLQNLLDELQLPKQRGKEIKEQLECYAGSTFVFKERRTTKVTSGYLFDEINDGSLQGTVTATMHNTGVIPFLELMQYIDLEDERQNKKCIGIRIILSDKFTRLSQEHAVPINYTVYKNIGSVVGKDLYTWFVYRNNSIKDGEPLFISRKALVDQFMPLKGDDKGGYESEERVNWNYLKEQIKIIKEKHYPDLQVVISGDNDGITFYKSKPVIEGTESRYMLVTSVI